MQKVKNIVLQNIHGRDFLADIFLPAGNIKSTALFIHGFKGFKDWGHWDVIAERLAEAGILFIKFNFSHNGTTIEAPMDFEDLEAFGQNNFLIELDDIDTVIDWMRSDSFSEKYALAQKIEQLPLTLIGHSRGGGIAIIKAAEDSRVEKLITWAAVHDFGRKWNGDMLNDWADEGVRHILNGRTGQQMPLYYQLYETYATHRERLDIPSVYTGFSKPHLIIHGTEDPAVPPSAATALHRWNPDSQLIMMEGADHVFGGRHPFDRVDTEEDLPEDSRSLVTFSIDFILNQ